MELHDYPRPANDTGIGVHWAPGYAAAVGLAKIRESWLPQLKAMGVKWVKVYNHDGALDFAELLLAEGIMPVVRIYRPNPNPSRLGVKELVHIEALVRAGVRYFEFNSEPDRDGEWRGGRLPADALELVVENTVANMESILERGGLPAIPALSNGSRWDLVGKIVAKGRRDLLDGPVWQAVHNYSRNRPLDYPYDIGNQEGAAFTQRFYQALSNEAWGENAWRGRSLEEVNRLRLSRANPGATIADDHACFLAYKYYDALNRRHLGRSLPILSTESGYLVGEDVDARYPATTPDLHMAQTLEAARIMMGTSQRYEAAPDYYFCTAFWLIGNSQLNSTSNWWESHAWFSSRWPGGALPVVHALRAEPKVERRGAGRAANLELRGVILNAGDQCTVVLEKDGAELQRATLDAGSRYLFEGLAPGRYTLRIPGRDPETVDLAAGQRVVVMNFDLAGPDSSASNSVIAGMVRGGANAVVVLLRTGDGEEWVTMARDDGRYRFVDLPAGSYTASVHANGSRVEGIAVDGHNERTVDLAVAGWGYTVERVGAEGAAQRGAIRCIVEGWPRMAVRAQRGGWHSETVAVGSAPHLGPNACEIAPLDVGDYTVSLLEEGGESAPAVEARVHVDRHRIPVITFVYTDLAAPSTAPHSSQLVGHVVGRFDLLRRPKVALFDAQARRIEQEVDQNGWFLFEGLPAGVYSVAIVEAEDEAIRSDITLDGVNRVEVELALPAWLAADEPETGSSAIAGYAPAAAGGLARLIDSVGNEYSRVVDGDDRFYFDHLPAAAYTLTVDGGYEQEGLVVSGGDALEVLFSPLLPLWRAEVSDAGSMPGFSAVRVDVEGYPSLPVRMWQEDGVDIVRTTGGQPGLGETVAEFGPLGPGRYMVAPDGIDVAAEVELTGLERVWVHFRRRIEPITAHLVRPLPGVNGESGAPAAPEKPRRYLFVGALSADRLHLEALLRFVAAHQPEIGHDVEEALRCEQVVIAGRIEPEIEERLTAAGVSVEVVLPAAAGPADDASADDEGEAAEAADDGRPAALGPAPAYPGVDLTPPNLVDFDDSMLDDLVEQGVAYDADDATEAPEETAPGGTENVQATVDAADVEARRDAPAAAVYDAQPASETDEPSAERPASADVPPSDSDEAGSEELLSGKN